MNTSNKIIGRVHRVREKSNDEEGAIVVQFSFYKYEINILRSLRSLSDVSQETMQTRKGKCKEVIVIRKQSKISKL